MEQFEKVCKGLQTAVDSDWMWRKADYIAVCCKDALALIRQQQERIKELEAAQTARIVEPKDFENNPDLDDTGHLNVWEEYKDGSRCGWNTINVNEASTFRDIKRYWTQRPTDEQREAAAWQ